jgi:hypothetical protein
MLQMPPPLLLLLLLKMRLLLARNKNMMMLDVPTNVSLATVALQYTNDDTSIVHKTQDTFMILRVCSQSI